MKIIGCSDFFIRPILEGCKTSKISTECDLKVGEQFSLGDSVFEVTKINRIRFDEITNEIALKEGFTHRDILEFVLEQRYMYMSKDTLRKDTLLYQIEFKKVGMI